MATIEHFDGSSTTIDQEADGSWSVVTTDAAGNPGGTQSFGANYTAQELAEKYTYSNDVVDSSSVEHDDGSKFVIDQLGGGGWSVYQVDAQGNQGPSQEFGGNYTREELAAKDSYVPSGEPPVDSTPPPPDPPQNDTPPNDDSSPGSVDGSAGDPASGSSEGGAPSEGEGRDEGGAGGGGEGGAEGGKGDEGGGGGG